MDYAKKSLEKHYEWHGKLEIKNKMPIENSEQLALAYTPGVAAACKEIEKDVEKSYELTGRQNMVAVITDGSAVLGLGNIGPEAAMPVMEGKCALFKAFAGVDAFPLCLRTQDTDEIVRTISLLAGSFGGINLEDISAPRCFEIERRLKEICDIPVFHDDQHGTAIVVLAALLNALKFVGKELGNVRAVLLGAGAAGVAISKLLIAGGIGDIVLCDKQGALYAGMQGLDSERAEIAKQSNKSGMQGTLEDVIKGADVFIGVSAPGLLSKEMVKSMAAKPIVFAMANPTPEIMPDEAKQAGAAVVGTGRSDFANQINNVLAFPGIFRGALDARAKEITEEMKLAAAHALAGLVGSDELNAEYILPAAFDKRVSPAVARAISLLVASSEHVL